MLKWVKRGVLVAVGAAVVGGLVFGTDAISYLTTGAGWAKSKVKNSVPIEMELQRAHTLLEEIIPEIHRNIQLVAQEEVEIAALKADMERSQKAFTEEEARIKALRNCLNTQQVMYTISGRQFTRDQVKEDLGWRFERFKEAEIVMANKKEMLRTRENTLGASMQMLERTKTQKHILASKIQSLESKHRLIKATTIGTGVKIDNSKIAQTEKLIGDIKKRLDVAERVLAHESHFVPTIPVEAVPETDLLLQIDEHFNDAGTDAEEEVTEDKLVAVY